MSLKAHALKSNEAQKKSIAKEVNSILANIDIELKNAHDQGKHGIEVPVPITFSIPYMSNRDSQRIIYYKILQSLLDREFNVQIELSKNSTIFHITWLSSDEQIEIDLQTNLLAKYAKKDPAKTTLN